MDGATRLEEFWEEERLNLQLPPKHREKKDENNALRKGTKTRIMG